jgi:hypothetical protein
LLFHYKEVLELRGAVTVWTGVHQNEEEDEAISILIFFYGQMCLRRRKHF